jgi:YtkA-like
MRVRPFFWVLLAASCIGVLLFAAAYKVQAPAVMDVHIDQQPPHSASLTTLELRLTDAEGVPIAGAQVSSMAWMTNMNMQTPPGSITQSAQGYYLVHLHLYMAGPWAISIAVQSDGFTSLKQTLFVQVT